MHITTPSTDSGLSPFEAGIRLRLPIDLVPLPVEARTSVNADNFIKHTQQIHEEVQRHISVSNDSYKQHADKRRRFVQFAEGDMVMGNRLKHLPPGANKKLHRRITGLFKILKKIGPNAYALDFPSDLGHATVNVEDLTLYKGNDQDGTSEE